MTRQTKAARALNAAAARRWVYRPSSGPPLPDSAPAAPIDIEPMNRAERRAAARWARKAGSA